jgi:hypothetical protein
MNFPQITDNFKLFQSTFVIVLKELSRFHDFASYYDFCFVPFILKFSFYFVSEQLQLCAAIASVKEQRLLAQSCNAEKLVCCNLLVFS